MITTEQRDSFIKKHCELRLEKDLFDGREEDIHVYMDGCYLTLGKTLSGICSGPSVIDFLINAKIDHVESIYESKVACVGFSSENQKWYGWSHRGCCGFGVGSEVKKGDCAYNPSNKEDFEEDAVRFWTEDYHKQLRIINRTEKGFDLVWVYSDDIPNKSMRGKVGKEHYTYPNVYGRGEWRADSLDDAHQMAIDYANNIG